jgi:hypothetical protein
MVGHQNKNSKSFMLYEVLGDSLNELEIWILLAYYIDHVIWLYLINKHIIPA